MSLKATDFRVLNPAHLIVKRARTRRCLNAHAIFPLAVAFCFLNLFITSKKSSFDVYSFIRAGSEQSLKRGFGPKDVFVHLHIQKSGGSSFGHSLLRLNVHPPCVARRNKSALVETFQTSIRPNQFQCVRADGRPWLFSRYTSGWPCGVHPSLDRLKACVPNHVKVDKQHLVYITLLRNPVERFLSEFLHDPDGWSRWNDGYRGAMPELSIPSDFFCNGTLRSQDPSCYNQLSNALRRSQVLNYLSEGNRTELLQNGHSRDLTLWDYLACPSNYLHNRQTRMLAQSMPCHIEQDDVPNGAYENLMLASAIETLESIPFFGLSHRRLESERLFEWTFGLTFRNLETTRGSKALALDELLSERSRALIEGAEYLDMQVWRHANKVFEQRVRMCGAYCKATEY